MGHGVVSPGSGSRDPGPRHGGRRRRDEVRGRRHRAVGCLVDSCRTCASCQAAWSSTVTSAGGVHLRSPDAHMRGEMTYGGYSTSVTMTEDFVRGVPDAGSAAAAPCCAPASPSTRRSVTGAPAGKKVGIVGLGGLGHMGVKFAHALGARPCSSRRRRARWPTVSASGPMRWSSRRTPRRAGARRQLRPDHQHRVGVARSRSVHQPARSARGRWCWWAPLNTRIRRRA